MPLEQPAVRLAVTLLPGQLRTQEGLLVLRVGHGVGIPAEGGELAAPARAHSLRQVGVAVVGEVQEGRARAPFLALEQHGHEGGK